MTAQDGERERWQTDGKTDRFCMWHLGKQQEWRRNKWKKNYSVRENETSKRLGNGKEREKWKTRVRQSESNLEEKQDLEWRENRSLRHKSAQDTKIDWDRGGEMEWAVFQDLFTLNIASCLFVDTRSTLPQPASMCEDFWAAQLFPERAFPLWYIVLLKSKWTWDLKI